MTRSISAYFFQQSNCLCLPVSVAFLLLSVFSLLVIVLRYSNFTPLSIWNSSTKKEASLSCRRPKRWCRAALAHAAFFAFSFCFCSQFSFCHNRSNCCNQCCSWLMNGWFLHSLHTVQTTFHFFPLSIDPLIAMLCFVFSSFKQKAAVCCATISN